MKILKIFLTVLIAAMLFTLTGCSGELPEDKAQEFITAFKEKRFSDMTPMLIQGENYVEQIYIADNSDSEMLFDYLANNLEYTLQNVEGDEKRATVTFEMTNTDMAAVMDRFLENYFKKSLEADPGNGEAPDLDKIFTESLSETLNNADNEKKTSTVEIKLYKGDDGWLISDDWAVFDGLTGGYISFAYSAGNALEDAMENEKIEEASTEQNTNTQTLGE